MNTIEKLKRARQLFGEIAKWLWSLTPLWLIITALVLSLLSFRGSSCLEQGFRLFGMCLQLLGVTVVALGLNDTRRVFNDLPTTWERIRHGWQARPRLRARALEASALLTGAGLFGPVRLRINPDPATPLDERVAKLEQQYASLFDEVGVLGADTKKNTAELAATLSAERKEREEGDIKIRALLRRAIGEGIFLQAFGVAFFVFGIIAGSLSKEIVHWLGGAACPN
jgi:hypothetical protein